MIRFIREKITSIRYLPVLFVVCVIAACAVPAGAVSPDEEAGPRRQTLDVRSAEPVTTKAMRVMYDPETGEFISVPFRETDVLSAPIAKALTRSAEGVRVFELESGGTGVHLDGRFQHALMVRMKPDGSLETLCTNHSHEAEQFLKGRTAEAKPTPRDK